MNVYWKIQSPQPRYIVNICRAQSLPHYYPGTYLMQTQSNCKLTTSHSPLPLSLALFLEILCLGLLIVWDEIGCVLFWSISWRDFFLASLNQFWGITNKLNMIPAARTIMESTSSTLPPPDNADLIPVFLLSRLGSRYFKIKQIGNRANLTREGLSCLAASSDLRSQLSIHN